MHLFTSISAITLLASALPDFAEAPMMMIAFAGAWILSGLPAPFIRQIRGPKADLRFLSWMAVDVVLFGPIATLLALL